jgi:hypothetical protein
MFLTSTAVADTWTVDDDGKADFDNIQAAVDAASDGDEIVVMLGTYTSTQDGHVVNMLGKAVTLRSIDPSHPGVVAATIIDGEGARRGMACYNNETSKTILSGFTIANGLGVGFDYNGNGDIDYWENYGGGMYNYSSSPTLENCIFTGNTATDGGDGGGMCNFGSNTTLTNCTFDNNTASTYGGGMYNVNNSNPTLADCIFISNTAGFGGGMQNYYSNSTLMNCTFTGNTASHGGGVRERHGGSTLTNCTFENNTASTGGGMYTVYCNSTLTNCTFTGNIATKYGGGINNYNSESSLTLTDTTVCGNTPDQVYGDWNNGGGNTIADECPECPDINGDGYVNVSDLLVVIDQWGLTNSPADLNFDGIVDVTDLLIVVGNWGACE